MRKRKLNGLDERTALLYKCLQREGLVTLTGDNDHDQETIIPGPEVEYIIEEISLEPNKIKIRFVDDGNRYEKVLAANQIGDALRSRYAKRLTLTKSGHPKVERCSPSDGSIEWIVHSCEGPFKTDPSSHQYRCDDMFTDHTVTTTAENLLKLGAGKTLPLRDFVEYQLSLDPSGRRKVTSWVAFDKENDPYSLSIVNVHSLSSGVGSETGKFVLSLPTGIKIDPSNPVTTKLGIYDPDLKDWRSIQTSRKSGIRYPRRRVSLVQLMLGGTLAAAIYCIPMKMKTAVATAVGGTALISFATGDPFCEWVSAHTELFLRPWHKERLKYNEKRLGKQRYDDWATHNNSLLRWKLRNFFMFRRMNQSFHETANSHVSSGPERFGIDYSAHWDLNNSKTKDLNPDGYACFGLHIPMRNILEQACRFPHLKTEDEDISKLEIITSWESPDKDIVTNRASVVYFNRRTGEIDHVTNQYRADCYLIGRRGKSKSRLHPILLVNDFYKRYRVSEENPLKFVYETGEVRLLDEEPSRTNCIVAPFLRRDKRRVCAKLISHFWDYISGISNMPKKVWIMPYGYKKVWPEVQKYEVRRYNGNTITLGELVNYKHSPKR